MPDSAEAPSAAAPGAGVLHHAETPWAEAPNSRAESNGDWKGHLAANGQILNLFAATGHINYAKSAKLYLQKMADLETEYPWLYQQFKTKYSIVFVEQTSFGLDYGLN